MMYGSPGALAGALARARSPRGINVWCPHLGTRSRRRSRIHFHALALAVRYNVVYKVLCTPSLSTRGCMPLLRVLGGVTLF